MSLATQLAPRIESRLRADPVTGCWLWVGATNRKGYGKVAYEGRDRLVHCVVYEVLVGPIPDGLQLDHLCRTKACANPAHLEPVTNRVNGERWSESITHCPAGHERNDKNTHVETDGSRKCRICHLARQTARYHQDPEYRARKLARDAARKRAQRETQSCAA